MAIAMAMKIFYVIYFYSSVEIVYCVLHTQQHLWQSHIIIDVKTFFTFCYIVMLRWKVHSRNWVTVANNPVITCPNEFAWWQYACSTPTSTSSPMEILQRICSCLFALLLLTVLQPPPSPHYGHATTTVATVACALLFAMNLLRSKRQDKVFTWFRQISTPIIWPRQRPATTKINFHSQFNCYALLYTSPSLTHTSGVAQLL